MCGPWSGWLGTRGCYLKPGVSAGLQCEDIKEEEGEDSIILDWRLDIIWQDIFPKVSRHNFLDHCRSEGMILSKVGWSVFWYLSNNHVFVRWGQCGALSTGWATSRGSTSSRCKWMWTRDHFSFRYRAEPRVMYLYLESTHRALHSTPNRPGDREVCYNECCSTQRP